MRNATRWMRARTTTPMDLEFSVVSQERRVELVAAGSVTLQESFDSARGLRNYDHLTPALEEGAAEADRRHGRLSLGGDQPFFSLFRSQTQQAAPYCSVVADVATFAGTGGEQDAVFVGLVEDEGHYLMAWFSHASGAAGIDAVVEGRLETLAAVDTPIESPCRVAFCLTGLGVTALIDDGGGFRPLVWARLPDRLPESTLATYRNGFGARASSGTITLTAVEAGYFGQAGLRDPHLVTHADGTPYTRFGKAFLTMTHAGMGSFETAHWGVWTLDLASHQLDPVGKLFFRRGGSQAVLGDHAGHLVRDDANDRWIVTTSSWGDFAGKHVGVTYTTVPASTDLVHGVHVLDSQPLPLPVGDLPSEAVGQWDPHLVNVDDRWHLAFVNARAFFDFYPALARSEPGGDFTDLSLVGADPSKTETEGVTIQRLDGQWYVLASNGDQSPPESRGQYPVYDLAMTQVGALNAPHPSNIPWPTLVPTPASRGRTRWLMLTFDGTAYHREVLGYGSHGDLVLMEAKPLTRGQETRGSG